MATNTSILGLTKPTYAEDQDITVLNGNSDLIDAEAGRTRANFAGTYSATHTYAVGDYCIYQGNLYRCTTAISSGEAWNSAHWSQVSAGDELASANEAIANLNSLTELSVTLGSNVTLASWGLLNAYKLGRIVMIMGAGVKFSASSGELCTIAGVSVSKYIAGSGYVEGSNDRSFMMTASPTNTNRVDYESVNNLNNNAFFQMILFVN